VSEGAYLVVSGLGWGGWVVSVEVKALEMTLKKGNWDALNDLLLD